MNQLRGLLFTPIPVAPYAVLRIVVGVLAITGFAASWANRHILYSNQGYLSTEALGGVLDLGKFTFSHWFPSAEAVTALYCLGMIAALSFAAGLFSKISGFLLYLTWLSLMNRNPHSIAGDGSTILLVLLPLLFTSCGSTLSLDSLRCSSLTNSCSPIPLYLLRLQLMVAYFFSGFYKSLGDFWLDGTATSFALLNPVIRRFPLDALWLHPTVWGVLKIFTWLVVFWELTFFIFVSFPKTRPWVLCFGLVMHTCQFLTIETGYFAPLMVSMYVVFLSPDQVERFLRHWQDKLEFYSSSKRVRD